MNILKYFENCYQIDEIIYFDNLKSIEMFLNLKHQFKIFKGMEWKYEP